MYHMNQVMRKVIPNLEPYDGSIVAHARAYEIKPMTASQPFWQHLDNAASTICKHFSQIRTSSGWEF